MRSAVAAALLLGAWWAPSVGAQPPVEKIEPTVTGKQYWLVTRDGQRLEASGPWEIRGRRLVYPNLAGDLVSIRADEIDLEASELATNPPPPEPPSAAIEATEPILVLDSNLQPELAAPPVPTGDPELVALGTNLPSTPSVSPERGPSAIPSQPANRGEPAEAAGDAESGSAADASADPGSDGAESTSSSQSTAPSRAATPTGGGGRTSESVRVTSWRDMEPDFDIATIYGTLANSGSVSASRIEVYVLVLDHEGVEIGRHRARVMSSRLQPGETTHFTATLSDVTGDNEFGFEVTASN